jgi:hypothetical protein
VGGSFTKNAGPQDDMLMPIHLTATEQADLVAFIQTLASSLPRLTPPAYTNLLPKPAPAPRAPHACSVLYPDQGLLVGTPLSSCNGHFSLTLEDDGDLVLSEGSKTVWASATTGESSAVAFMRNDGNFVVFDATGKMVWSTGTVGNAGASLSVTDNGELVLENVRGKTLWNSKQ